MKIHQIDLNQSSSQTTDPVVDDALLSNHNQASSDNGMQHQKDVDMKKPKIATVFIFVLALSAGVATGFGSHKLVNKNGSSGETETLTRVAGDSVSDGDVFGSSNADIFKDDATGYLEKGGIDGEGSHKLLRPGGVSQTVYLTSSVTDLDKLVGMEVKVWGETFSGQKAGWLMDVGRIEVVNTKALPPTEE